MHLLIFFSGSDDFELSRLTNYKSEVMPHLDADHDEIAYLKNYHEQLVNNHKQLFYNKQQNTIFVMGCSHSEVCDSLYFPNLKSFAERFAAQIFLKKNDQLFLAGGDSKNIGIMDNHFISAIRDNNQPISSITLCGYSRVE